MMENTTNIMISCLELVRFTPRQACVDYKNGDQIHRTGGYQRHRYALCPALCRPEIGGSKQYGGGNCFWANVR